MVQLEDDEESLAIAQRWCQAQGPGWTVINTAGRGGTAPVYEVRSPNGDRALKLYDRQFSEGEKGEIEAVRVSQQVALGEHGCPFLVSVFDGGQFEGRLFLLMGRAPGRELAKVLHEVPRSSIRRIVHQVATACLFLRSKGLCHRDIKSENVFVSDDFETATLLDLSVMRDITDPIGNGTDHGGQLPIVATARYSPPEYLFRIVAPSPESWHALDVYQLGGLLHDLIMREQLFEADFRLSKENRYRFAWTVATVVPDVHAFDVDQDLIMLARRALDKNWDRRGSLRIEDFLDDANIRRLNGLQAIGLAPNAPAATGNRRTDRLRRIADVATAVKAATVETLVNAGVTPTHRLDAGASDHEKLITLAWDVANNGGDTGLRELRLEIKLTLKAAGGGDVFDLNATMMGTVEGRRRTSTTSLLSIVDGEDAADGLSAQIGASLGNLASKLLQVEAN